MKTGDVKAAPRLVDGRRKSLYQAMKDAGLEGCVSGPGDAARNHSKYLKGKPSAGKKAAT